MDPPPRPNTVQTPRQTLDAPIRSIEQGYREITWSITPALVSREPVTPAIRVSETPASMPVSTLSCQKGKQKITPAEHLILMNHVCEHASKYTSGKTIFWKKISKLFEEDTSIFLSIVI
jgi:hypothetical protein